jgi:hypothetical protein
MKFPILFSLIFALAGSVFGQLPPTTVNTVADLLNVVPNPQKPLVMVLGSTSANDGLGGDYIWSASSAAPTNTAANGGPIARPYGAAFGRWIKRTQYVANLRNPTLFGTVSFPSTATVTFSPGGSVTVDRVISTSDSFTEVNPQALVTKAYVDAVGLGGSTNGIVPLESMAELVAVAGTLTHGKAYLLTQYYTNDWGLGVGGGIWIWNPISDYPTNRGVIASARGGRFFPQWHNGKIDPRRLGAANLRAATVTDPAFQSGVSLQQDITYNDAKELYVPEGVWRISSTIVSPRTGTATGSNAYELNSGTNFPAGTTTLYCGTGSGTIIAGDNIQFSTSETEPTYRVLTALSGGQFTICAPGLQSTVASNATVYIRPMRPLVVKGMNNGIHLNPGFRGQLSSEIMMETANIPIIEMRETKHGRLEDLSLTYQSNQLPANTNAACLYNGPDDELFQWTVRGITMNRGAYGVHVRESTAGANNGMANSRFDDIITRSATVQCLRFAKSGTVNKFGYGYIQNIGFPITNGVPGPSETQSFTNAVKTTPGTEITLNLVATPAAMQVGTFVQFSYTNGADANFNKQAFVKSITNNILVYDCESAQSAQALVSTGGSLTAVQRQECENPLMFVASGCEMSIQALDVEVAIGPKAAGQPTLMEFDGIGAIDYFHGEYTACRSPEGSLIRVGGQLVIGNARIVNCGKLAEINQYVFEVTTANGLISGTKGWLQVGHFGVYDFSTFPGETGVWRIQTNRFSCDPAVIGKYSIYPTIRNNATSTLARWGAKTPSLIDLP